MLIILLTFDLQLRHSGTRHHCKVIFKHPSTVPEETQQHLKAYRDLMLLPYYVCTLPSLALERVFEYGQDYRTRDNDLCRKP